MNILLVNDSSFAFGGATAVFLKCIGAALRKGHRVSVFVGDDGKFVRERFPEVLVVSLNQRPLRDGLRASDVFLKTYNTVAARTLEQLLNALGNTVLAHVHGWSQILSPSIFHVLSRRNVPTVVTAHDFFLACPNGGFIDFSTSDACRRQPLSVQCLRARCDKRNHLHKLWRSQRTFVQSAAGKSFWSSVTVILVHERMTDYLDSARFGRTVTLRSPTEPFVVHNVDVVANQEAVFLGRISWEKGADVVARASVLLEPNVSMLGQGPLLEGIRRSFPQISCPGWVDRSALPRWLSKARVFLMPSRMPEPYGLVAVEAMMAGIPVIVGRSCLIAAEVVEAGAGFSVEPGNEYALSDAVREICENDDLAQRMSRCAFRLGNGFAPPLSEWEERLLAIYEESARGASPRSRPHKRQQQAVKPKATANAL